MTHYQNWVHLLSVLTCPSLSLPFYLSRPFLSQVNCLEPHPHIPVLATSGLDHDVKLFTPSAPKPTVLDGLSQVTRRNGTERQEAQDHPVDGYEMIMQFILRQYRRGLRVGGERGFDVCLWLCVILSLPPSLPRPSPPASDGYRRR